MKEKFKIFVINPGSTSTKLALFENEELLYKTNVFHEADKLAEFPSINGQLDYRFGVIRDFLRDNDIDLSGVDAIVGRGGSAYPMEGGVYVVDDLLIKDTKEMKGGMEHPSNLGVQLAEKLHDIYGGQMFTVDPPVVDELSDLARMTGIKGIYRKAENHALNLKGTAKLHAKNTGRRYEDCNFIVCHIDGGISISAHEKGRIVDCNDAAGGDGPYTPSRIGSISVADLIDYCRDKDINEVRKLCTGNGGLISLLGTNNSDRIHEMVAAGDKKATRVWQGMIYQIVKYIGAMATVLGGRVDDIILTGGLVRFADIVDTITAKCGWIAPVTVYPDEVENEAMAAGALSVLRGETKPRHYNGKSVFTGFDD